MDSSVAEIAERQHGVVGRRQLLELGLSPGEIESRLRRQTLLRVHQGAYAVGHRALTIQGHWMAAVLAHGSGAVLSHRAAGQLWQLLPRSPVLPEVTRPTKFRPRPGIVAHHARLPADEIDEVQGIPITSAFRTIFDLAGILSRRQLERALHEAEVRRLTGRLSLPDLLGRYPRHRGAANLRGLLAAKAPAGVTQSELEELFVDFLDAHGLLRPRLNATLPIRGRLLRPDCMWPEQRLIAELDGRDVHRTDRAFESDRQRDRILLAEGWRSTRITWRQLQGEPAAIAADLRGLLRA